MQVHQLTINLLINYLMRRIRKQCFIICICFEIIFFYSSMGKIQQIILGHICYNHPAFASRKIGFLIFNF